MRADRPHLLDLLLGALCRAAPGSRLRKLVADGAIGRVIQTIGLGPHRLNRAIRPAWFFDVGAFGGILTDIASHQIDQFLFFTGSTRRRDRVERGRQLRLAGSFRRSRISARSCCAATAPRGYIRVDWFTPDGLPTWGDGRLFLLGTEGFIELRKYIDIAGRPGTDHLFLSDRPARATSTPARSR